MQHLCDDPVAQTVEPLEGIVSKDYVSTDLFERIKNALCCGGGDGRMWIETEEKERLSETRVQEALGVEAALITAGCPWGFV